MGNGMTKEPLGPHIHAFMTDHEGRKVARLKGCFVGFQFHSDRHTCDVSFEKPDNGTKKLNLVTREGKKPAQIFVNFEMGLDGEQGVAIFVKILAALTGYGLALHTRMFEGKLLMYQFLPRRQ